MNFGENLISLLKDKVGTTDWSQTASQNIYAGGEVINVKQLYGDTSYKVFFRCVISGFSFIYIHIPGNVPSSEESFVPVFDSLSQGEIFTEVNNWLLAQGFAVPAILCHDPLHQHYVTEDVGDVTLFNLVQSENLDYRQWYFAAIDWLVQLQQQSTSSPADTTIAQRELNQAALAAECQDLLTYSPKTQVLPDWEVLNSLAAAVAATPQVIIHRDFQSKNMLVQDDTLWVIDNQDMCMGPIFYDLASLLYDPYVPLPEDFIQECIQYYLTENEALLASFKLTDADCQLGIMQAAKQRLYKAAGRYQRFSQCKSNDDYLPYYEVALQRIEQLG